MRTFNMTQKLLWLGTIILVVVLVDQSVKRWMVEWIGPGNDSHRVEMLGSLVAFEYLENRGAAFGLFAQSTLILAVISVVIIGIGIGSLIHFARHEFWLAASIALILGGAIGNAIDRFVRGFVVDFIAIGSFWKFNLADSAITLGVVFSFLLLWQADTKHHSTQENTT